VSRLRTAISPGEPPLNMPRCVAVGSEVEIEGMALWLKPSWAKDSSGARIAHDGRILRAGADA
jgi:hypothetical protein